MLDFLKSITALGAAIRIQRQGFYPLGSSLFSSFIVPGERRLIEILPPSPHDEFEEAAPYRTRIGTDALTFSHASVSVPLPPPSSVIAYFNSSTRAGDSLVAIFVLPRSCVAS